MTKLKKLSTAIVSILLASTMCVSFAACGGDDSGDSTSGTTDTGSTSTGGTSSSGGSSSALEVSTDSDGNLSYTSGISLNMNVGYNTKDNMNIAYTTNNLSGDVTMPDGVTYSAKQLKPAWQGLSDTLNISFVDCYTNLSASSQITTPVNAGTLNQYDVITGQSDTIVTQATAAANTFLNLADYLDYMPNYKKFLEDNPVVYMSLISDTESGAMYYAPYFDGNDDIEKYELARLDWTEIILDDDTPSNTITFAAQADAKKAYASSAYGITGTSASVESYMGTTGSWKIASTDSDDDTGATIEYITVNYTAALTAAQTSGTALNTAMTAVDGVDVTKLTSGNIVDLQNAAINATNGAATGEQLINILKAYIDVTYLDDSGNSYYSTRSDVFNASDAAWDVDLLVALSRCIVTAGNTNLGTSTGNGYIYGITGRQNNMQRLNDVVSLVGELYGVRGLASRYNYTYIDSDGNLQEARAETDAYEALDKFHALAVEGLYNIDAATASDENSYYTKTDACEAYMQWDYVQTQTASGGFSVMGLKDTSLTKGYDYEPINTPVSLWNDGDTSTTANADGITYSYSGNSKYMRFTESWRSVKNTGWAVPYASVAGNPEKLAAVLAVIDYFFSNDGQILMTFGTQSSTNNATTATANYTGDYDDGWWYGTEVTSVDISTVATMVGGQYYINDDYASTYFCYNNHLYTGTLYNGRQYPQMTNANLAFYYGKSVNGVSQSSDSGIGATGVLSYTNYARYIIGSALPIGNKLQAFEAQCTSDQGLNGANKVALSLVNGTISHVYQQVGTDNGKGYWYTIVPTTLPYDSTSSNWISQNVSETLDGAIFSGDSGDTHNFFIDIIEYGLGGSCTLTYVSETQAMPSTAQACVDLLISECDLDLYVELMQDAWDDICAYYWTDLS